jgi:hypothetical protein
MGISLAHPSQLETRDEMRSDMKPFQSVAEEVALFVEGGCVKKPYYDNCSHMDKYKAVFEAVVSWFKSWWKK